MYTILLIRIVNYNKVLCYCSSTEGQKSEKLFCSSFFFHKKIENLYKRYLIRAINVFIWNKTKLRLLPNKSENHETKSRFHLIYPGTKVLFSSCDSSITWALRHEQEKALPLFTCAVRHSRVDSLPLFRVHHMSCETVHVKVEKMGKFIFHSFQIIAQHF